MATTHKVTVPVIQDRTGWVATPRGPKPAEHITAAANLFAAITGQPCPTIALRPVAKPHLVKYTVGGHSKTRSFEKLRSRRDTDLTAERFRDRILTARAAGEAFDTDTGEPMSWAPSPTVAADTHAESDAERTVIDLFVAHTARKWNGWKGNSRKSAVEALSMAAVSLVRDSAPSERQEARKFAARVLLNASVGATGELTKERADLVAWFDEWSLPLSEVKTEAVDRCFDDLNTFLDGSDSVATSTFTRRRNALHGAFNTAVRNEWLASNPIKLGERKTTKKSRTVDMTVVPTMRQSVWFICILGAAGHETRRHIAWYAIQLLAGLRPCEAADVYETDLDLPETGWGELRVWGGTVAPGAAYSNSGTHWDDEGQKWRDKDEPARRVPLSPIAVCILRHHISSFGTSAEGRLFVNSNNNPLSGSNTGRMWRNTRNRIWPTRRDATGKPLARRFQNPLSEFTPYDLRHAQASFLLDAGVKPAEVARRLGHSLPVLFEIYASLFDGDEHDGNDKIDDAIGQL